MVSSRASPGPASHTTTSTHTRHPHLDLPYTTKGPILSLTDAQEHAVRTYLDEKAAHLERDERTRKLGLLSLLVTRLSARLHDILAIPPAEPWGSIRVAYLLAFTPRAVDYIVSLPLVKLPQSLITPTQSGADSRKRKRGEDDGGDGGDGSGAGFSASGPTDPDENPDENTDGDTITLEEDGSPDTEDAELVAQVEEEASETMRATLDLIADMERGWVAVLRGQAWIAPEWVREIHVKRERVLERRERRRSRSLSIAERREWVEAGNSRGGQDGDRRRDRGSERDRRGESKPDRDGEADGNSPDSDSSDSDDANDRGEPVTVPHAELPDPTSCVRLKSIAALARDKFLVWARRYGDFGGEVMETSGAYHHERTEGEEVGWEREVRDMWTGILRALGAMEGAGHGEGQLEGEGDGRNKEGKIKEEAEEGMEEVPMGQDSRIDLEEEDEEDEDELVEVEVPQ